MRNITKIIEDSKECSICHEVLPFSDFYLDKNKTRGITSSCKKCSRKYNKENHASREKTREYYYSGNRYKEVQKRKKELQELKDRFLEYGVRWKTLSYFKQTYNITIEEYLQLIIDCDNKCIVCNTSFKDNTKNRHVDHDHATGKVRGILCGNCNIALGLLKDNPNTISNLLDYINKQYDNK